MPSTSHPTYYSRTLGDAASNQEKMSFFRDLPPDNGTDTGDVESPLGWVGLFEVTWHDIIEHLPSSSTLDDLNTLGVEPGWYIVRIDDNGLVWAMSYGQDTHGEEQARADFAEAQDTYAAWVTESDI